MSLNEFVRDFPVIYKYREWSKSKEFHKRLLTEKEIWFSSPADLNDPFDCAIPFKLNKAELTPENILKKYRNEVGEYFPDLNEKEREEKVQAEIRLNRLNNPEHLDNLSESIRESLKSEFGIFCVSKKFDDILMWSYYSNAHTGFVIGFDTEKLLVELNPTAREVIYEKDFPEHSLFYQDGEMFLKLTYVKSDVWNHEDEVRLIKKDFVSKSVVLSKDCFKEVILGCRIASEDKSEIKALVKERMPHVSLFQMATHKEKYSLTRERIN